MLNLLCCKTLKCCCRKIRRRMVQAKIKEYDAEE